MHDQQKTLHNYEKLDNRSNEGGRGVTKLNEWISLGEPNIINNWSVHFPKV